MKWGKVTGFIMILMLGVLLIGCNSSTNKDDDSDKSVELTLFTRFSDGASKEFFDEVAKTFHEKYPNITIKVSSADNANYKQEINVKLASSDTPDIFFAWSGVYAENFAESGRALDLTEYLSDDEEWSNSIISNQFGPFTFDDKVYGIPLIMDGKTFYYNQDIFTELDLEVPETWDEFMAVLEVLGNSEYIPISLGNQEDWATGHYMTTLNQRMVEADVLDADYRLEGDFSDPAYIAALNKLEELTPYFTEDFNSTSYDTGISDFVEGKAAIYYEQFNQVQYIEPAAFNWSWFDFPDIEEGKGDQDALTGAPQGLMISSKTEYPEEAVLFLKYLTSLDIAQKMVKDTSMISCVDGAITVETANEKLVEIAETIKSASSINLWLDNVMNSELATTYLANIQAMVAGKMTAEEVMEGVQAKAEEVIKEAE